MRVVMVGPFGLRPRGTMSVRALPMAQALAARGHTVTELLPPWQNPEDAGRCWDDGGVAIENIALPPRVPLLFHLLTAMRLTRRTLALKPDVVHIFKPKAYSGLTHWLLARIPRTRRPRLIVDTDDWEGPGGWNELADYSPAERRFFAWQERWGLTHADAVTAASRSLEGLVWALGVQPARVVYVPNGVPRYWIDFPAPPTPASTPPTILLYTRFFEFPITRVIDLLQLVRAQIPDAQLLVVGKGLFGEEETLLEVAQQVGLAQAITYAGWVAPEQLPAAFARADVAIYPFDDNLINRTKCPVKLLDLLTAAVPVVAEAVGEIKEMIRHAETGWLVEPGDVVSFAEATARLLRDGDLRRRMGTAASADIATRRSWDRLVESVELAYGGY
jgi:glycosyltransferase involved in cell wall biosynthesis